MAFGAELIARLGLDTTAFNRGLSQAVNSAGGLGKALNRKVGTGDAFKGLVAAFGISVENLAEKVAEAWVGGTREGLQRMESLVEEHTELIAQKIRRRAPNDEARLGIVDREMKDALAEQTSSRKTKVTGSQFNYITGRMEQTTAFAETEEEFNTRRQAAANRVLKLEAERDGLTKKIADTSKNLDKQLADAKDKSLKRQLDASGKVALLTGEKLAAEMEVEKHAEGTDERKKAEIELEKTKVELLDAEEALQDEINKTSEDNAKLTKEQTAERKRLVEETRRLRDAEDSLQEARDDEEKARGDAYRISIQDAAQGRGGVTQTNKARAREIERLEARAQRIFQGNYGGEFRDQAGNLMSSEDYAKQLQSRAEGLRQSSGFLKSSDRDPFEAQREAVVKSEKHLADIKASLAEESGGGK